MPGKSRKKPTHHYSVSITAYANEGVKTRVEAGQEFIESLDQLGGELRYQGHSERVAAWEFYRACIAAKKNPLAYLVTLYRGSETIIEVKIKH